MSGTTCCLCRAKNSHRYFEPTTLPGTGYRCIDHAACHERVRAVVEAHTGLAGVCDA